MIQKRALNDAGSLDYSFGDKGFVDLPYNFTFAASRPAALDACGRILIAGRILREQPEPHYPLVVSRLLDSGRPDLSFGVDGTIEVVQEPNSVAPEQADVVVKPDNRIVVACRTGIDWDNPKPSHFYLAQYHENGDLDTSFGVGGIRVIGTIDTGIPGIAVQPDGRILVCWSNGTLGVVLRLMPDGTPDPEFGVNGEKEYDFCNGDLKFEKVVFLPDLDGGRIQLLGRDSGVVLARLLMNGDLDVAYGTDGYISYPDPFPTVQSRARDMAVQQDHKAVVCGYLEIGVGDTPVWLFRTTERGLPDPSFNDCQAIYDFIQLNRAAEANAVAIQADGKIVIAGKLGKRRADPADAGALVVRYLADGSSRDDTFGTDGKVMIDWLKSDDRSVGLAIQPDGKLLVTAVHGITTSVIRLLA